MSKGQNNLIGRGMKPRGKKRVKPQKETEKMMDQSTVEGQEAHPLASVLEPQEGDETPANLEPENGDDLLQNLENSEATVAHDCGLEAALEESGDVIDAQFAEVDEVPKPPCDGVPMGKRPTIADIEEAISRHGSEGVTIEPNGEVYLRVGLQPDGSTKVIVAIPEGVFEPVNELAKDRGISYEQWCNEFFQEALDAYFSPAGKR